jgi:hypothetical protein
MALRITIDIFSGRPNPVVELNERESKSVLERLRPTRPLKRTEPGLPPFSTLGYRGLIIEQTGARAKGLPQSFRLAHGDVFGPELAHRIADDDFEDFFLGSTGPIRRVKLGREFPAFLRKEIDRFRKLRIKYPWKPIHWPRRERCRCAPLYEPNWWNDGGQRQWNNNCYNYSTNYRTDTFAQPGLAAGAEYTALTCAAVRPAAIADDLIDSPGANNKCPKEGHLVALVIAPGWDFHWYRKGRNGYWTHKPGGTSATNVDNSGVLIPDPRTADRGPYTNFCTFMVVMHGHIKIR